jgi:hypothetical protein
MKFIISGILSYLGKIFEKSAAVILLDMVKKSEDLNTTRLFIESTLRNMSNSLTAFTIIKLKDRKDTLMDSLEYKGLKRLEWPGKDGTNRQRQRFFKQLQLRLPEPNRRGQVDEKTPLIL